MNIYVIRTEFWRWSLRQRWRSSARKWTRYHFHFLWESLTFDQHWWPTNIFGVIFGIDLISSLKKGGIWGGVRHQVWGAMWNHTGQHHHRWHDPYHRYHHHCHHHHHHRCHDPCHDIDHNYERSIKTINTTINVKSAAIPFTKALSKETLSTRKNHQKLKDPLNFTGVCLRGSPSSCSSGWLWGASGKMVNTSFLFIRQLSLTSYWSDPTILLNLTDDVDKGTSPELLRPTSEPKNLHSIPRCQKYPGVKTTNTNTNTRNFTACQDITCNWKPVSS